jgi:hypothetical protein
MKHKPAPRIASPSTVIGPDRRDGASVRRLPDDRLMLARRGPPRIVLGVFPDWQALARYVASEAARVEASP